MSVYVINLSEVLGDDEKMEEFQAFMDTEHRLHKKYVEDLSRTLGVSHTCASHVIYLRSRSRHTPELEEELIRLHKAGTPPNIFDFP